MNILSLVSQLDHIVSLIRRQTKQTLYKSDNDFFKEVLKESLATDTIEDINIQFKTIKKYLNNLNDEIHFESTIKSKTVLSDIEKLNDKILELSDMFHYKWSKSSSDHYEELENLEMSFYKLQCLINDINLAINIQCFFDSEDIIERVVSKKDFQILKRNLGYEKT